MADVRIPNDLNEAMEILYEDASEEDLEYIRNQEEDEIAGLQHFNAGIWIRNWNLWDKDSEFRNYLENLFDGPGKYMMPHPDDLSGRIIEVFHRYVRDPDIDPEEEFVELVSPSEEDED